jgi:hypothetical protein
MHAWFTAAADERIAVAAPAIGVQVCFIQNSLGVSEIKRSYFSTVQGFAYAVEHNEWHARVGSLQPVFDKAAEDLSLQPAEVREIRAISNPSAEVTSAVVAAVWDKINPSILRELDAPSSLRCIAPRPLLVMNGGSDPRCPALGVQLAMAEASKEYKKYGAEAASNIKLVLQVSESCISCY